MEQLEVVIYDEINNYEEKIKGLTFRQWIFSALMVIIVVPSIFILSKKIGDDLAQFIVTIEAAIIGFIGFIKIHDLKAEQLLPIWYRHFFKFGKPLTYITDEEWEKAHEKKNKKAKKIEAVEEPKAEKSQKVKKEKAKKEKNIKKVEVLQEKTLSDKSVDLKEDKVIAKEKEKIQQQKFAEPKLSKKELKEKKAKKKYPSVAYELAEKIQEKTDKEVRITVPGHTQRGGSPCAYDRVLATRLGAEAARAILEGDFGCMVGTKNQEIIRVPLSEVAGKLKYVDPKASIIKEAKTIGISFGDE